MSLFEKIYNMFKPKPEELPVHLENTALKDPPWMSFARGELGVEEKNPGDNARIVWYHSHAKNKYKSDETAWCSSFVCTCLEEVGLKSTDSEWANSFANSPLFVKLLKPIHGCIVVFKWNSAGQGHVAFYDQKTRGVLPCLGGNQSNKVCIQEYGSKRNYLVGYYWPKGYPTPGESIAPSKPNEIPVAGWHKEYDEYIKEHASAELLGASVLSLVGSDAHSVEQQKKYLCAIFKAMAVAESGLNPFERYVEKGLGSDMLTKEKNTSEGLFQVSYQDSLPSMYACKFDWAKDKKLPRDAKEKTIFNGLAQVDCAMRIMTKLLKSGRSFEQAGSKYWSVLQRNRSGWKRFKSALEKEL